MDYLPSVNGMSTQLFRAAAMYLSRMKTKEYYHILNDLQEQCLEFCEQSGLTHPRNEAEEDALWILVIALNAIKKIQPNTRRTVGQLNTANDIYNVVASEVEFN